jgi:hypothetical protein
MRGAYRWHDGMDDDCVQHVESWNHGSDRGSLASLVLVGSGLLDPRPSPGPSVSQ